MGTEPWKQTLSPGKSSISGAVTEPWGCHSLLGTVEDRHQTPGLGSKHLGWALIPLSPKQCMQGAGGRASVGRWWPWLQKPPHLMEAMCQGKVEPLNQPSQGPWALPVPAPEFRACPTCAACPWVGEAVTPLVRDTPVLPCEPQLSSCTLLGAISCGIQEKCWCLWDQCCGCCPSVAGLCESLVPGKCHAMCPAEFHDLSCCWDSFRTRKCTATSALWKFALSSSMPPSTI